MSYVKKIIAPEEKLIGIARLHWIYILKGLGWLVALTAVGWGLHSVMTHGLMVLGGATNSYYLPATLISWFSGVKFFMICGGFFIFLLMVIKVLTTEVALTSRRVMLKEGLLFVKVKQVDLEEIRGENLDLGTFGRLLGYGYLLLDCRFVGDVRLPAIENSEQYLRALHHQRAHTQDALSVVVGKGYPYKMDVSLPQNPESQQEPNTPAPKPETQPSEQPQPEINPPRTPGREIPAMPTPHSPPPSPTPPPMPEQPTPQPPQPTEIPLNEPPLQRPDTGVSVLPPVIARNVSLTPEAIAQVVQQMMPQMAQQMIKEMSEQGLIHPEDAKNDNGIDNNLIHVFDEARFDEDHHDNRPRLEHVIH